VELAVLLRQPGQLDVVHSIHPPAPDTETDNFVAEAVGDVDASWCDVRLQPTSDSKGDAPWYPFLSIIDEFQKPGIAGKPDLDVEFFIEAAGDSLSRRDDVYRVFVAQHDSVATLDNLVGYRTTMSVQNLSNRSGKSSKAVGILHDARVIDDVADHDELRLP